MKVFRQLWYFIGNISCNRQNQVLIVWLFIALFWSFEDIDWFDYLLALSSAWITIKSTKQSHCCHRQKPSLMTNDSDCRARTLPIRWQVSEDHLTTGDCEPRVTPCAALLRSHARSQLGKLHNALTALLQTHADSLQTPRRLLRAAVMRLETFTHNCRSVEVNRTVDWWSDGQFNIHCPFNKYLAQTSCFFSVKTICPNLLNY